MPSSFLMMRRPPRSPLFPYTTLFRSPEIFLKRLDPFEVGDRHAPGVGQDVGNQDRKSTRLNSSHSSISYAVFFFNDAATTEISPLSLHDALPISRNIPEAPGPIRSRRPSRPRRWPGCRESRSEEHTSELQSQFHLVCRLLF